MYVPLLVSYLVLASGLVHAFGGGWVPFAQNVLQGRQAEAWTPRSRDAVNAAALRLPQRSVPRSRFRAHPNEYEAFFNKACKSGVAVMNKLSPEERAQRALEGEELEDKIIEIATVLREKADTMVADTGAVNFDIIQPMMDEISVLKAKYKLVVGAVTPTDSSPQDGAEDGAESEGEADKTSGQENRS